MRSYWGYPPVPVKYRLIYRSIPDMIILGVCLKMVPWLPQLRPVPMDHLPDEKLARRSRIPVRWRTDGETGTYWYLWVILLSVPLYYLVIAFFDCSCDVWFSSYFVCWICASCLEMIRNAICCFIQLIHLYCLMPHSQDVWVPFLETPHLKHRMCRTRREQTEKSQWAIWIKNITGSW